MSLDKDIVNEVNQSLGRCYLHGAFMDKFYNNFKAANPAIPPFFVKTDMNKQYKLLKEGLTYLIMSAGGSKFAGTEIDKLGIRHDTSHLNVNPSLYKYWVDALMKTVRDFDDKFSPELERKWRMVLQEGIQSMTRVHQDQKAS